jgi:hypothetical protein
MDAATANIIAALIAAIASIAVAFITTRARIGHRQLHSPTEIRKSIKMFRALGWALVALLYLIALDFLVFGIRDIWVFIEWHQLENIWLPGLFVMASIVLFFIGFLAQDRLRHHAPISPPPQSN